MIRVQFCWDCRMEREASWDPCPACGNRHSTSPDRSKIWRPVATLKLLRKGVILPPPPPPYGEGSRISLICDLAMETDRKFRIAH